MKTKCSLSSASDWITASVDVSQSRYEGAYIKGDRMDLYVEDWDVAKEFGRKKLQVVILERRE